jgi:hypothetical protein
VNRKPALQKKREHRQVHFLFQVVGPAIVWLFLLPHAHESQNETETNRMNLNSFSSNFLNQYYSERIFAELLN